MRIATPNVQETIEMKFKTQIILSTILAAGLFLAGCGGGGGGSSSGGGDGYPSKVLRWNPPTTFTDNSALSPALDLDVFEVYVKEEGIFSTNDSPMAALLAVDAGTGQVTTSFDLANLGPFLSRNITYFASIRVIAKNGMKSDFSQSATFSF